MNIGTADISISLFRHNSLMRNKIEVLQREKRLEGRALGGVTRRPSERRRASRKKYGLPHCRARHAQLGNAYSGYIACRI